MQELTRGESYLYQNYNDCVESFEEGDPVQLFCDSRSGDLFLVWEEYVEDVWIYKGKLLYKAERRSTKKVYGVPSIELVEHDSLEDISDKDFVESFKVAFGLPVEGETDWMVINDEWEFHDGVSFCLLSLKTSS